MHGKIAIAAIVLISGCATAAAQQASQVQLKIEPTNRALSVSAEERVTADPEIAILHIGFETQPSDAKTAYAAGAKTSNEIVAALKQAGIPESSIRSESQHLDSIGYKSHKFKLVQHWTVKDERALEDQALEQAATRAKDDAAVLAKGMGVHLGALIYVTNQVSTPQGFLLSNANNAEVEALAGGGGAPLERLSIEPRKVSRVATAYAVFAIE
jgi:uncharacterized protein YggE